MLFRSREIVAWGPTETVMTAANLTEARHMAEAWDESAHACAVPEAVP